MTSTDKGKKSTTWPRKTTQKFTVKKEEPCCSKDLQYHEMDNIDSDKQIKIKNIVHQEITNDITNSNHKRYNNYIKKGDESLTANQISPHKKSCCDRKSTCKKGLAQPKCSGLFLNVRKPKLRMYYPKPEGPILPPKPKPNIFSKIKPYSTISKPQDYIHDSGPYRISIQNDIFRIIRRF